MTASAGTGRLAARIALITGASRGIGAAVARRFAAEGAHVVLAARSLDDLRAVEEAILAGGGRATPVPADLLRVEDIDALAAMLRGRFGRLDILVGNAGMFGPVRPLAETEPGAWQAVMDLNLAANYHLIRTLDPLLRASPAGRAIFVTSRLARHVVPHRGLYAMSKAALEMMIRVYAAETVESAVRVNLVDPGNVRTRMRAEAVPHEDPARIPPPEAVTEAFVRLAEAECRDTGTVILAQQG